MGTGWNCYANLGDGELVHSHREDSIRTQLTVLVTQLSPTICDPVDCSPPGSLSMEFFQARILEWVAISFVQLT